MVEDGIEVAVFIYLISDLDEFFWAQYCAKGTSFAQCLIDFYPCQDFDTPLYGAILSTENRRDCQGITGRETIDSCANFW